ncbi:unnamed protein product [Pseudo-nitzschia multistriata]|uniref:Uncharacterized protein n=1 Tax=Pseudo-nitzschia multistriata TaxID=183589 RepID=A0A448Z8W8_9STRA|nr:unnamed protein product [Pseudo-nitzschia multistriata]
MSNFDADFFRGLLKEEREEALDCLEVDLDLEDAFVEACHDYKDAKKAQDAAESEEDAGAAAAELKECFERCVETAKPILDSIDLKENDLDMSLLRTAMLVRGGPKSFAKFADHGDLNGQLVETLLNNKKIMKGMILNGGPMGKKYGNAMRIYTQIMAGIENDRFHKVNKKLAMAVALEFAHPQTEFDTNVEIDAQKRFNHYATAHKKGELDPAFSYFSIWELRMAINSDATNEQLQWGRDMQMTYAPHIASIYNERWRYGYMVYTDVGHRAPNWTSSPRTYQQLLSGGGREGPRAWFGRFICRAFGIPVWGFKQHPNNVGLSRWTPKGWQMVFELPGSGFDSCYMDQRPATDFIEEANARSASSEQEYYEKVVLLDCLGDVCKEKMPKDDASGSVDPNRMWRSLALIQRKLLAERVRDNPKCFERKGPSIIKSKIEKYIQTINKTVSPRPLKMDDAGAVTVPAASFAESNGKKYVRSPPSFGGGNQLHLVDGEGFATYEVPSGVCFEEGREYELSARVATVHLVQQNLKLETTDGGSPCVYEIEIPYTLGEWQDTEPVRVRAGGASTLKIFRKKATDCFGLAIKSFTFTPC